MKDTSTRTGGILNIQFKNKDDLFKAYMPFVNNGGLFIPTIKEFQINDELFILLHLPGEVEKTPVSTKVVWITPRGAQEKKVSGIGVQFKDDGIARSKIENVLGGLLNSDLPNLTM